MTIEIVPQLWSEKPVPLWFVQLPSGESLTLPFDWVELLSKLNQKLLLCEFRGVPIDRFDFILTHGIDVMPTDSVIYADGFEKAWEYGSWPKLILALDGNYLKRTFIKVAADTSDDQLAATPSALSNRC